MKPNWKNVLMQVLDSVSEAEGYWFHERQLPAQLNQLIEDEYAEWLKVKEQNEQAKTRVGKPPRCTCERLKHGKVDCPMHGTVTEAHPYNYEEHKRFLENWYKDRGVVLEPIPPLFEEEDELEKRPDAGA